MIFKNLKPMENIDNYNNYPLSLAYTILIIIKVVFEE